MAMTDSRKLSLLAIAAACLAVLSVAFSTVLEPLASGLGETARRRERYERAVSEKGLTLHEGMYWKEKE